VLDDQHEVEMLKEEKDIVDMNKQTNKKTDK